MDRRKFLTSASAAVAANAVAPLLPSASAQSGPIRIGLLAPLTGVVASGGKEMVEGFDLFWDQHGRKIAGREIEITVEDDASQSRYRAAEGAQARRAAQRGDARRRSPREHRPRRRRVRQG